MIPGIGIMNPKFKIRNGLLNGLVHLCEFNESSGNAIEEVLDNNGINNNISYQQSTVSNLTYSYLLNGSSSDINFGNINNFEYSDPVTFGIWINPESIKWSALFSKYNGSRGYLIQTQSDNTFRFSLTSSFPFNRFEKKSGFTYNGTEGWIFFVVTYNGNNSTSGVNMYFNGVKDNGASSIRDSLNGSIINSSDFIIGSANNDAYFNGYMDQPFVYNKVLTSTEIEYLYNLGNGLPYSQFTT